MVNPSSPPKQRPDDILAPLLVADSVPMEILEQRYKPLLEMVRVLIGVVPNCDKYLEIWPPAFRTYNVMVPNFLNLPFSIFGVGAAPKKDISLGMYVASRVAECAYCSAHTCSFALRRGMQLETLAQVFESDHKFTDRERATIAVARSLGRVPCELTKQERGALEAEFSPQQLEWVVMGVVMMGFLNKFMDALGVELEVSTVAETSETMGEDWRVGKAGSDLPPLLKPSAPPPADTLWTKLSIIRYIPSAIRFDADLVRGVPDRWPAVGKYLEEKVGFDFGVLSKIRSRRVVRAIGAMIRDNMDSDTTVMGLPMKVRAGVIFSEVIGDATLGHYMTEMAPHHAVSVEKLAHDRTYACDPTVPGLDGDDEYIRTLLWLARAASPSPAQITTDLVEKCRKTMISAPVIVEMVCWLSVLQMLHRLVSYFSGAEANDAQMGSLRHQLES
ncbi:MAG: hypothetical protein KTR25_02855 [Myxococcales bacterium]|nr:hypothetical protein [Myxococcales bacterium]